MIQATKRAKVGGEFGANGEWYEGGRFINTIPENQKVKGSHRAKIAKQEIEPFKWVVPQEGQNSIYRKFAGVFGNVVDGVAVLRTDDRLDQTCKYMGVSREQASDLINRWNAGERWL